MLSSQPQRADTLPFSPREKVARSAGMRGRAVRSAPATRACGTLPHPHHEENTACADSA